MFVHIFVSPILS